MSDPDPIQEMQKLDDIEADLADTAMAIIATDEPDLVTNAEAVETILEQAIPDAPAPMPAVQAAPDVKEPMQIPLDAGLPQRPMSSDVDLPAGLTTDSPSVIANRGALTGELLVERSDGRHPRDVQLVGAKVGN